MKILNEFLQFSEKKLFEFKARIFKLLNELILIFLHFQWIYFHLNFHYFLKLKIDLTDILKEFSKTKIDFKNFQSNIKIWEFFYRIKSSFI